MRKFIGGSVALAAVAVIAVGAGVAAQGVPNRAAKKSHPAPATKHVTVRTSTTSTSTSTSTTSTSTTTSTTLPKHVVDVPAGTVMLGYAGRHIWGIDAQGHDLGTIVTVYPNRLVVDAQLMSDGHTIWYDTAPDGDWATTPNHCSDVVRLDLWNSHRTVIAHATDFSVTPDGGRVVLDDVEPDSSCGPNPPLSYNTVNVVRDVATGAQSIIKGEHESLVISPDGSTIAANLCHSDPDGCHISLESAALPGTLGAPVALQPINDQKLTFLALTPRTDGLYATVDPLPQHCGCGGPTDRYDNKITVRRFSWADLGGAGTQLFDIQGPMSFDGIVPTSNGLYATGRPSWKVDGDTLYRIVGSTAEAVRTLPNEPWTRVTAMP